MPSVVRFCPIAPMMARMYIVPGAMTVTSMFAKSDALAYTLLTPLDASQRASSTVAFISPPNPYMESRKMRRTRKVPSMSMPAMNRQLVHHLPEQSLR